jgi:predicted lipopolysaccharide heptosyltransferase III
MTGHKANVLRGIKNILIIQLGDIGDIVWCIPTLWAIKESIPGVKTCVVVREGFGELLQTEPSVADIFEVKKYKGSFFGGIVDQVRFFKKIRSRQFDMVIDLRAGDRGAFLSFLSGAAKRVSAHYGDVPFWRNLLFTNIIHPRPSEKIRGAAEQSLRIVRELGIDTADKIPRLTVSDQVNRRAKVIMAAVGLTENVWITVNPFSRWSYKELPEEKWIDVLDWLEEERGLSVALVGSPDEREKAEKLKVKCKGKVFNLTGETTLAELAGVLSLSRLHIGVDSAALHIAAAVGTPTISVYGPSDWKVWAPFGGKHRVVMSDLECIPCRQKGCNGTELSRCLVELDTNKIKTAIREAINTDVGH